MLRKSLNVRLLVVQLRLDELTVQTGDIGDTFALRTHGLTSAGVRTVTEAEFVHLGNHGLGTACSLRMPMPF